MSQALLIADIMNGIIVAICILVCVYLWRRQGHTNAILLATYATYITLAISLFFEIKPIYRFIDTTILPFNNLPWLINIVFKSMVGHFVIWSAHYTLKRPFPKHVHLLSGGVATLLVITFFAGGLHQTPMAVIHITATSVAEAAFLHIFLLYGASLTMWGLALLIHLSRHEAGFVVRYRFALAIMNGTFVFGYVLSTSVLVLLGLSHSLEHPAIFHAYNVTMGFIIGAALTIIPFYIPEKQILRVVRAIDRFDATRAVKELQPLRHRLNQYCPPILERQPLTAHQIYTTVELRRHQMVVDIIDRKLLLHRYLQLPLAELIADAEFLGEWVRHSQQRSQAKRLLAQLQKVDDNQPFADLVKAYRRMSRRIRQSHDNDF